MVLAPTSYGVEGCLDADSLILQAIAGLCAAGGIPQEKAPYFHEKVHPLVAPAVEFLMETMPDRPDIALLLWLAAGSGGREPGSAVPPDLATGLSTWAAEGATSWPANSGGESAFSPEPSLPAPAPAPKSAMKSALKSYVTPAGTHVSEEEMRARGTVDITDDAKVKMIMAVPMFSTLDMADIESLAKAFDLETFLDGEEAMKHGEAGQGVHIVCSGQGRRLVSHEVGVLGPGDSIGEAEMLKGVPINETVEAVGGPMTTLHLDPLSFKALGLHKKIGAMQRRKGHKLRDATVAGGRRASAVTATTRACEEDDFAMIAEGISANANIREVLNLSEEQINYCAREAYRKDYEAGDVVFEKGEYGHRFYIVVSGVFVVTNSNLWAEERQDAELRLKAGDSFGELALLYNAPRAATVTCKRSGSVWVLSRTTLKNCKQLQMEGRISEYSALLRKVAALTNLVSDDVMPNLCNALEERSFIKGEVVLQQGAIADCFNLIFEGCCVTIGDGIEEGKLGRGAYFGEKALLDNEFVPAPVTVKVTSDRCTVLTLTRTSYEAVVSGGTATTQIAGKMVIHMESLQKVGVLGTGSFGFVSLVRHSDSAQLYALKAISKGHIMRDGLKNMVLNEKACQQLMDSEFVVRLLSTYRDEQNIYLLLEPCFGGELFDVFNGSNGQIDLCGSEVHVQFFAACAALGLEHMHSRRVIYRDLKLENCLLTLNGYLKLTDLGISKVCVGKTYTVCGTADYFAPEMLRQTGHNRAVDWWALGVMTYMMIVGRAPFEAPDTMKIYRKIIKGFAKVNFPDDIPEHCTSMIRALCQRNPEERLTMGSLGLQNFKDHPWYRSFSWMGLEAQTLAAPYTPMITEEQIIQKAQRKVADPMPVVPYEESADLEEDRWDDAFDMTCEN